MAERWRIRHELWNLSATRLIQAAVGTTCIRVCALRIRLALEEVLESAGHEDGVVVVCVDVRCGGDVMSAALAKPPGDVAAQLTCKIGSTRGR